MGTRRRPPARRSRRPALRRRRLDPAPLPPARQRRPRSRPPHPRRRHRPRPPPRRRAHAGELGRSAGALAHDVGWTRACAGSGTRPACHLAPAIQFVGTTGTPATARRAPAQTPAPPTSTSPGPRRATAPASSHRPATGSWRSPSCRPTTRPPHGPDPRNRRDRRHPRGPPPATYHHGERRPPGHDADLPLRVPGPPARPR
jgi:hypothetical protein